MSEEDVNRIEPNGSTALLAAAYQGHERIVELLLEKGADYSLSDYELRTPVDVAKTDAIKQRIYHCMSKKRFVSNSIEWVLSTANADYQAAECWKKLHSYGEDPRFYQLMSYIKQYYLERNLQKIYGFDKIKGYFDRAINERDPSHLLKAYTADTGFYSALNIDLAKLQLENLTCPENLSLAYYVGIIAGHPQFETLSYTGKVFRGMRITSDDLKRYNTGTRILTKSFSSASQDKNVALIFRSTGVETNGRLRVLCTYEIRNRRTALDIRYISEFEDESEVLIMPYTAFKIIRVQRNEQSSNEVEIQLKECEPW